MVPLPILTTGSFVKPAQNPILNADSSLVFTCPLTDTSVAWQAADVFNPAAVVRGDLVGLLYRAEDNPRASLGGRTSRIGLAWSDDGIHFTRHPQPVLFPARDNCHEYESPGGCEDPRVVETGDGGYVVTYTGWNQVTARLCTARSDDLVHWEKMGPAFSKADGGKFAGLWTKSGAIVTAERNGRPVAVRLKGRYWMYWGEQFINLAWSENLHDWNPLTDSHGSLLVVAGPRRGKFDSALAEAGPPALLTPRGIVLLYNGKNAQDGGDPDLPAGTYSVGEIVFDPAEPEQILARTDKCLMMPSLPHEVSGQYAAGTTFAEGLVFFKGRWFLYYGTADSFVGVAVIG